MSGLSRVDKECDERMLGKERQQLTGKEMNRGKERREERKRV